MLNRVAFAAIGAISVVVAGVLSAVTAAHAQAGPGDLLYRVERLENQIRQMTGDIEQLQYRNQQLEAALNGMRPQEPGSRAAAAPPPAAAPAPYTPPATAYAGAPPATSGGRRSDAFDPAENPSAPGAPRPLGSMPPQPPPPMTRPGMAPTPYATGAADGYGRPGADADYARPSGGTVPRGAGANSSYPVATAAPPSSGSAREIYDAGVVYLQRRDYAAAEETFRDFLNRYPSDRRAAEAQFNLGESLYQRQNYQEAATAFVQVSKKYETSAKAPDALLRLGQSLAALNEKELACVAFGDVGRKYPRAPSSVKQAVDREQKRARC